MRVDLEPAWILHRKPYRESSLLLDVLSLNYGRVGLIARGARRPARNRRYTTEPFQALRMSWSGRGELMSLTAAEASAVLEPLSGRRLWTGLYINELLMRLIQRNDPCPEIFQHYGQLLHDLAKDQPEQPLLRNFEVALLHHLGYGLVLDMEVGRGRPIQAGQEYEYLLESGPVCWDEQSPRGGIPVNGATLLALERGDYERVQIQTSTKLFMRQVLRHHLGERPLQSIQLFRRGVDR